MVDVGIPNIIPEATPPEKALEKPIFNETRDFFPTFKEAVALGLFPGSTQILVSNGFAGIPNVRILYTVPENSTYYITQTWLDQRGGTGTSLYLIGIDEGNSYQVTRVQADEEINIDHSMPLILNAGEVVILNIDATATNVQAGVIGVLVSKRIS